MEENEEGVQSGVIFSRVMPKARTVIHIPANKAYPFLSQ